MEEYSASVTEDNMLLSIDIAVQREMMLICQMSHAD
jgi:hypothetical protein